MAVTMSQTAVKRLAQELRSFEKEPLEGVRVELGDDGNMYRWMVSIFGAPDTIYTGGFFKAHLVFPDSYPFNPPKFQFATDMWHPNVYKNGEVCISILHPPGENEMSGELPEERWNPTQSVRTILLSVISLLNEPNTSSPANVDASVMYRAWREGKDTEYERRIKTQVDKTKALARAEGIVVPVNVEDYVIQHKVEEPEPDFMMDEYESEATCSSSGSDVELLSESSGESSDEGIGGGEEEE